MVPQLEALSPDTDRGNVLRIHGQEDQIHPFASNPNHTISSSLLFSTPIKHHSLYIVSFTKEVILILFNLIYGLNISLYPSLSFLYTFKTRVFCRALCLKYMFLSCVTLHARNTCSNCVSCFTCKICRSFFSSLCLASRLTTRKRIDLSFFYVSPNN
jgi:hypothetical protein